MKFAIITNSINNILEYTKIGASAFIFGLKNYSSGYNNEVTIDEIREIRETYSGELFIAINKNIFNRELEELETIMKDAVNVTDAIILVYADKQPHTNTEVYEEIYKWNDRKA